MKNLWDILVDKFYSIKNLGYVGSASIIGTGISAFFWLYLANLLGAEDYGEIQKATQTLERFLGRKVYLRPNPEKWPVKKSLVTRLHEDSKYRRSHIKKG